MLLIGTLFVLTFYLALLVSFSVGWFRQEVVDSENLGRATISVVVCARNEESNIAALLEQLLAQSFPAVEIIVVDDGSNDNTANVVRKFTTVKLLSTVGVGKKKALKVGIEAAVGELIVCTDADCMMGKNWLLSMANCYTYSRSSMIIAPVKLLYNYSFWQRLQALEFMSLAASTAGAASLGHPVMCNGANLAFTKEAWLNSCEDLVCNQPSGDDMFLMMSLKRKKGNIRYLKSKDAMVATYPSDSLKSFSRQRSRWVSKSTSYTDFEVLITASLVLLVGLMPLVLGMASSFEPSLWKLALFIWGTKTFADTIFLSIFCSFFDQRELLWYVLPLSLFYPFYLLWVTVWGLFGRVSWKGVEYD